MLNKTIGALIWFLFILGPLSLPAWAGPRPLTDEEMDGIYAQGVVISLEIQLGFPGGGGFSLPSFDLSIPVRAGANPGGTAFPGSGINLVGNPLQGGTGLTIIAATAAISMTVNVVLANNSIIGGNIVQNTSSFPTNLFLSVTTFSP